MGSTTETNTTPRRNQRKTPLTPKKRDGEDDESLQALPNSYQPSRIGGGRIKKAKVPFDPSENNFPRRRLTVFADNKTECWTNKNLNKDSKKSKKKSTESSATENDLNKLCTICSKIDKRLGNLISCQDCVATAHNMCIRKVDNPQQFSSTVRNWICSNCETCVECYESALMQPLYKCISCNSCYHLECNDPNFNERSRSSIQKNKFRCKNCIQFTENFLRKSKDEQERKKEPKIATSTSSSSSSSVPSVVASTGSGSKKSTDIASVKKNLFTSTINDDASSSSSSKRITEVGFAGFDDNELNQDKSLLLLSAIDDGVTKDDWKDMCDEKVSTNAINSDSDNIAEIIKNNDVDDNDKDGDIKIVETESLLKNEKSASSSVLLSSTASSLKYLDEPIPNVETIAKWTKDDVYKYFLTYFPKEAIALKNKNIDGITLLIMKRDDVVGGLEMNLGPALRMYHHLLRLQMQKNDISLGWL